LAAEPRRVPIWVWAASAVIPIVAVATSVAVMLPLDRSHRTAIGVAAVGFALAGLVQVPTPGRSRYTAAYMVVAALPLVHRDGIPVFSFETAVAALAGGIALTWVLLAARGDDQKTVLSGFVKRVFAYLAYLAVFYGLAQMLDSLEIGQWSEAVLFAAAGSAAFAAELGSNAVFRIGTHGRPRMFVALDTARDFKAYLSLIASGALFGLAFETTGWGALAVAALPYAFAHGAFRRYVDARQTYAQTMRSLARIPEVAGHSDPGHAARTAELAVGVAAELGLRPRDVDTVEYAALLHDIGRISLNEPSVLRMGFTDSDIAKWGSEIVGETSYLTEVSDVVLRQHEPYRNPGVESNVDVPIAAKIVKVCSAYDESTSELGFSPLESMEKLHRGSVYDYDPEVVAVLRRLLERRGEFDRPMARS
jgi:HD-GYP domain-containing protein (c-di-GMP phosphodiesterase class II)